MARFAKAGPPEITSADADGDYDRRDSDRPLTFAY